jgi:CRP/FNR family cyclic AMP-dependent transcriptional regulator
MKKLETIRHLDDLRSILFFKFIGDKEMKDVASIAEVYEYTRGETIISEGEVNPYIYAVIRGTVNVLVSEDDGKEVFICAIGEGDVFGEAGMFLNVKRTANISV